MCCAKCPTAVRELLKLVAVVLLLAAYTLAGALMFRYLERDRARGDDTGAGGDLLNVDTALDLLWNRSRSTTDKAAWPTRSKTRRDRCRCRRRRRGGGRFARATMAFGPANSPSGHSSTTQR